jgi:hypothetical protein
MPSTPRLLQVLALGAALLLLLLLAFQPRDHTSPPSTASTPTESPKPPGTHSLTLPPLPLAAATRSAAELRASLENTLLVRDACPHEAVLTFANADAYARFLARAQHRGLAVLGQLDRLLTVRIRYESLSALEAELLEHAADYANIGANHLVHIPAPPAKVDRAAASEIPFRNHTLSFLGVASDHASWGRGTTIAILDSGVAPDSTFGSGRVQYLNIGLGTVPGTGLNDGHGTSVAALAAGASADAAGIAPAAAVLSIRVTDTNGASDIFTVSQAILAAVDAGAPIINLSLGGYTTNTALNSAIAYAHAHGAVIVAAAGNDQAAQLTWPAADPRVVSVGAIDATGQQVAFSNSGPQLQIAAPGYGVQTAWLDNQRVYVDGTSASAPLVAGAIAAVMTQNPAFTAQRAWDVLRETASDAGAPGADADYGNGVLNLDWAMNVGNTTRLDPAIASHHFDAAKSQMNFVVQNRSARPVTGLSLDVDTNGSTETHRLPDIAAGASYVLNVPVDRSSRAATGEVTFTTQLVTPFGLEDANPGNNRRSSQLNVSGN